MKISNDDKIKMLWEMMRIRQFEERAGELYVAGIITGALHASNGQEAVPVGVIMNLKEDDYLQSSHRGHGHVLAKGGEFKPMMAELFGKITGYCKGRGGSMHFAYVEKNILGTNGIVGGGIPIAAGVGYSIVYKGTNQMVACFLGDGAANTGAFHEGINFAAVVNAPVLFVIENNQWAISVPRKWSDRLVDLSKRAAAYGILGETVDGNDVLAVYEAANKAVKEIRAGNGPVLLECKTYRWKGHHAGEPASLQYRDPKEVEAWLKKCPIKKLEKALLEEKIISEAEIEEMTKKIEQELDEAVEFAKKSPLPEAASLHDHLYV
ncbi:MAG: thiamine pyrophosphate-dependent dehydrogenase E1 component subunit alpha [Spirochaetota bacterium]|nr:MAG: thiamine pyrophosphate-dependent dehydrogenase E1 component subunit alpha [Spirochaetota bacterium]